MRRRRRRPMGGRRPPMRGGMRPGGPGQHMLNRAHKCMSNGQHAQAAEIFQEMAVRAQDRGHLGHAPNLFLQAARAFLLAGLIDQGMDLLRRGLDLLAKTRRWPALHRNGLRAVEQLKELGKEQEAQEISAWLDQALADHPEAKAPLSASSAKPKKLPAKCPYCGASVNPSDVKWFDNNTAECAYCGSMLDAES